MKIFGLLNKNLVFVIPTTMILGFVFGYLANEGIIPFSNESLASFIAPATFLMIYPMMIPFQPQKLFEKGGNKPLWLAMIINFAVIPFLAYAIGSLFFRDNPTLLAGLLLASLLPTSGMTISWTGFAKGNIVVAVKMTIVGLIVGSIFTPLYLVVLVGKSISINVSEIATTIAFTVFIPMILGTITRILLVKFFGKEGYTRHWLPRFPVWSTLGVLIIVFVAIALKAPSLVRNPDMIVVMLVPLLFLYAINIVFSTLVGRYMLNRGDGIALVYGTVMRNLSIALAIALRSFGTQAALLLAFAYIIQVQSAAWYVKFSDRFFCR